MTALFNDAQALMKGVRVNGGDLRVTTTFNDHETFALPDDACSRILPEMIVLGQTMFA